MKHIIAERITEQRKRLGLTQTQLADRINVTKQAVGNYEKGTRTPDFETLDALGEALHTTLGYLVGATDDPSPALPYAPEDRLPAALRPISTMHRQKVPLIGKVAAGKPIMAETDYETFVDTPVECDCALEVEGDSMVPTYLPGDIVYIKYQPTVRDGQVAVVLIDDRATLKHVYRDPDGLTLISDNPDYERIVVKGADYDYIAIYGVPVGYTRMYKPDPLKKLKKGMR